MTATTERPVGTNGSEQKNRRARRWGAVALLVGAVLLVIIGA